MKQNLIYLVALHSIGISQKKLGEIFFEDENYQVFWDSLNDEILTNFILDQTQREKILTKKKELSFEKLERILKEREVQIITLHDTEYPELLKNIAHIPYFFYLRGKLDTKPKIGIVGSRTMTSYGKKCIEEIIPSLGKYFTIVSGGALGCDSEAHLQAMKSGSSTLSIIGTGINVDYPASNKKLYDDIVASGGGIISIFPLGEPGQMYNFPIRNELISGISNGVLLVEAGLSSGTLITAQLALEQGKDVFAIPGDIYKTNSAGCNNMLKRGEAKMVISVNDILEEYNLSLDSKESKKEVILGSKQEESIYNLLILEDLTIDELSQKIGLNTSEIAIILSFLEIGGIIKKTKFGKYEVC